MNKITPWLWYDNGAEEAANLYTSLFNKSGIDDVKRNPDGTAFTVIFHLDGQNLVAMNAGPMYKFTEALSLFVVVDDQPELDRLWAALSEGGEEQCCGWLKDRFGLSWQIVPRTLEGFLFSEDTVKASRAREAMLKMTKLDFAALEEAFEGKA